MRTSASLTVGASTILYADVTCLSIMTTLQLEDDVLSVETSGRVLMQAC